MKALVIGAGSFGSNIATVMAEKRCEVVLIDMDENRLDDFKDKVHHAIVGDATDRSLLEKFVKDMDVAIISLGEKIDSSVLIALHLKELNCRRIIAKAASREHGKILKMIGVHQVVFPERDEARRLVNELVSPEIVDLMKLSEDLNIIEVAVPEEFIGKSVRELDLRQRYGLQLLATKNPLKNESKVLPAADYKFSPDDVMIVIGDSESLKKIRSKTR